MRISDWSSDVCSSDLIEVYRELVERAFLLAFGIGLLRLFLFRALHFPLFRGGDALADAVADIADGIKAAHVLLLQEIHGIALAFGKERDQHVGDRHFVLSRGLDMQNGRSEVHTSELTSPMRNSYAVFCL